MSKLSLLFNPSIYYGFCLCNGGANYGADTCDDPNDASRLVTITNISTVGSTASGKLLILIIVVPGRIQQVDIV